jgi:hypothetical protein
MSKQYDSFMEELEQLMEKHNVVIYTSLYDSIEVHSSCWSYKLKESLSNFEDRTENNEN